MIRSIIVRSIRDFAIKIALLISALLGGGGKIFFMVGRGGGKTFSSWKLNNVHNLTILVKGDRHLFQL